MIESTGAKLLKLPPYSPDLNPIEHAWANLKQTIKLNKHKKALKYKSPYDKIIEIYGQKSQLFHFNPIQKIVGLNK